MNHASAEPSLVHSYEVFMNRYEFLLQCPKCHNKMKYGTSTIFIENKRKRCVYCGKSYKAKDQIVKISA